MPPTARRCAREAEANFDSEGPAHCPDNAKIGTFSIGTKALNGRLEGAVYIGEPKPGDQYRLFEIASGFGINAKFVGSIKPDPTTGQLTAYFEDLPQVPFDDFQLHLFASDRGLMATPTRCTIYMTKAVFYPWNTALAEQGSSQTFGLESGPHGSLLSGPRQTVQPGPVCRNLQPRRGQLQLLHAEARQAGRRPVPGQAQLHDAAGADREPARHRLLP